MFTWIKKRCRRRSAPSCDTLKRNRDDLSSESNFTKPFYFELEDDVLVNNFYEEITFSGSSSSMVYDLAKGIASLTERLELEFSTSSEACLICRKNLSRYESTSSICTCYAEPVDRNDKDKTTSIPQRTGIKRRAAEDYDALDLRYSTDHIYSSLANDKRRRLFRSRSDIRRRPLPELPAEEDDVFNESESSGFYENIDSDSDTSIVGPYVSEAVLV